MTTNRSTYDTEYFTQFPTGQLGGGPIASPHGDQDEGNTEDAGVGKRDDTVPTRPDIASVEKRQKGEPEQQDTSESKQSKGQLAQKNTIGTKDELNMPQQEHYTKDGGFYDEDFMNT